MSQISKLLDRLDGVRRKREGQYMACCPAHPDKSPSLAVGEGTEGRVILHCYAGCSAHDIVTAIGLELGDLFPPTDRHYNSMFSHMYRERPKHLEHEDRVVSIGTAQRLTQEQRNRVKAAKAKGGRDDGFSDQVRREASKPLPSQKLTSVETEEEWNSLLTEAQWHLNRSDELDL